MILDQTLSSQQKEERWKTALRRDTLIFNARGGVARTLDEYERAQETQITKPKPQYDD